MSNYRIGRSAYAVCGTALSLFITSHAALADGPPSPAWTGFYVGGYGGGGAVNNAIDVFNGGFELDGVGGEGFVGGGMAGFNYQIGPRIVVGLQGDLGIADLGTDVSLDFGQIFSADLDAKPDFTASVSGRLGWLTNPDTLLYIIGGWSYAEYETEISLFGTSVEFDEKYDGFHIGTGIETRLTPNLTARIEYRYTRYDEEDWGTGGAVEVEPSTHTGIVGLAWNFYTPELGQTVVTPTADYFPPQDEPEPTVDWTGFYIGGYGGGGAVNNAIDVFGGIFELDGVGGEGFVGGGMAGFNYQVAPRFVVGIQGDLGIADLETEVSTPILGGLSLEAEPGLTASVSGRVGWLAVPDTMLYVIGGWSYAEYETEFTGFGGSVDFDEEYQGFHIGGGIETWLTDNLTARVEYRYTQYDEEDWGTGGAVEVEPSTHTGIVGIAWHFGPLYY